MIRTFRSGFAPVALAAFVSGVLAVLGFQHALTDDPYDRLLLPYESRVEVPPHMVIPSGLTGDIDHDPEWNEHTYYRFLLSYAAIQECFGVSAVAQSGEWQFVNGRASIARDQFTQIQIKKIKPGFLPQYLAMRDALFELDELVAEMRFANGAMSAWGGYSYTAYPTELLARLAHYQMAKGGIGGSAVFDLQAFDRSITLSSRSDHVPNRSKYAACRKKLMQTIAKFDKLLANWDPACARLIADHIIGETEDFQPLPR
jgi:hypothetical protein